MSDARRSAHASRTASSMSGSDGWQPIATAPRDGTPILVWGECDGEISGPYGHEECVVASLTKNGCPVSDSADAYSVQVRATHWMPLPPAPGAA